ncbi:hypothetical protein J4402_05225 [Candidatus Pacearchaeota archaeon]|nr:hypothetical protein [Candidatus Pacearchaeota archaeon]
MKKGMIITMPRYDDVTEYFSQFSKEVIKEAEKELLPVKALVDKEATKSSFEKVANSLQYSLVVMNGHGNSKEIFGQDKEAIISEGVNEQLLVGRITYARACEAAASLGKLIISINNEGCFIGYELPFQFYADITWAGNPMKDNTAKLFLEPSNAVPISLIKGKTAAEANENSKRAILKNMNKILRNADKDSLAVAEALWNNYEGQVVIGNGEALL